MNQRSKQKTFALENSTYIDYIFDCIYVRLDKDEVDVHEEEEKPEPDYQAWQTGQIDYMGIDSFSNIKAQLDATVEHKDMYDIG